METGTVTHRECFGHRMPLGTDLPGICPLGFLLSMMETVRLSLVGLKSHSPAPCLCRYECHHQKDRPANQHPGPHGRRPDHDVRFPGHWLWFHFGLESGVHVCGVFLALEGVSEDPCSGCESCSQNRGGRNEATELTQR